MGYLSNRRKFGLFYDRNWAKNDFFLNFISMDAFVRWNGNVIELCVSFETGFGANWSCQRDLVLAQMDYAQWQVRVVCVTRECMT